MSLAAMNIPRALLIGWAAIASLGVAAIAVYHAQTLGKLRTAQADLRESWRVNDSFAETLETLREDLGVCERQFASVQETAAADAIAHELEKQALATRLQETRNDLSETLAGEATPELAACLPLAVPAGTSQRLHDAADRAARAGGSRGPQMDSGAGAPRDAAALPGAPSHAGGMPD